MCMPVPESPIAGIDIGRRVLREAGDAHRAAHRLGDRLEALESAIRAVGAETLDGGVDQPRIELRQHLVPKTQPIQRARPEILQQHVGLRDHLLEQRLALIGLQVQRQAALVGVQDQEEQAVAVRLVAHVGARDVAALRLLQLDHVGAEKAEDLRAGRARLVVRHVDDANAGQGLAHGRTPKMTTHLTRLPRGRQPGAATASFGRGSHPCNTWAKSPRASPAGCATPAPRSATNSPRSSPADRRR